MDFRAAKDFGIEFEMMRLSDIGGHSIANPGCQLEG